MTLPFNQNTDEHLYTPHDLGESENLHELSDVDSSVASQHHTLGGGPTQAAAGNHSHALPTVLTATGSNAGGSATWQNLSTRCYITVPAGTWTFIVKGWFNCSENSPRTHNVKINDGTKDLDSTSAGYSSASNPAASYQPWALLAKVTYTAATTVEVQHMESAVDGTQLISSVVMVAIPCA